jgi:hypothetical protein
VVVWLVLVDLCHVMLLPTFGTARVWLLCACGGGTIALLYLKPLVGTRRY